MNIMNRFQRLPIMVAIEEKKREAIIGILRLVVEMQKSGETAYFDINASELNRLSNDVVAKPNVNPPIYLLLKNKIVDLAESYFMAGASVTVRNPSTLCYLPYEWKKGTYFTP